jgi:hypothetical protein
MDVYGAIGAAEPVAVVSGIQQLSPSTADDVLTLLNKRILVPDSVQAVAKGVFNFVAVTMERLAELGYKTSEATQNAGAYVAALPPGNYVLANLNDTLNIKLGGDFHITVAGADAVPVMAGPGSTLAVLAPLAPIETGATGPAKEEKKFSVLTPVLGAGIGLLVGGPVGAAVECRRRRRSRGRQNGGVRPWPGLRSSTIPVLAGQICLQSTSLVATRRARTTCAGLSIGSRARAPVRASVADPSAGTSNTRSPPSRSCRMQRRNADWQ